MTWWQGILIAFGGNAALLLVLGFLARSLIQTWLAKDLKRFEDSLARDAKLFELQLKTNADFEIERLKASFVRASRVHERQLDILSTLNRHFLEAQWCFQGMTARARFIGEVSREEYERKVIEAMEAARNALLQGRLFIPKDLVDRCETVFRVAFEGRLDFSLAHDPMIIDPAKRAELWQAAATAANQEMPKILQEIDSAARSVMHGEQL